MEAGINVRYSISVFSPKLYCFPRVHKELSAFRIFLHTSLWDYSRVCYF